MDEKRQGERAKVQGQVNKEIRKQKAGKKGNTHCPSLSLNSLFLTSLSFSFLCTCCPYTISVSSPCPFPLGYHWFVV
jgi:hypothetical protein